MVIFETRFEESDVGIVVLQGLGVGEDERDETRKRADKIATGTL